jgi:hypothetical protein
MRETIVGMLFDSTAAAELVWSCLRCMMPEPYLTTLLACVQCDPYVDGWDVRIWGIRIAIAVVIAALNSALKTVLEYLVLLEKHWTRSEQVHNTQWDQA